MANRDSTSMGSRLRFRFLPPGLIVLGAALVIAWCVLVLPALLAFLLTSTDARLFEAYSRFDQPIREFESVEALDQAFRLGIDEDGNGTTPFLQLWWPAVCPPPRVERMELDQDA
ncbi:MAG TPA: hypothetical protein VMM18_01015 [Gemmatimonadaceae bacterium]|nr:hypothetical protein [Gemmatimonadaceae bacterium]